MLRKLSLITAVAAAALLVPAGANAGYGSYYGSYYVGGVGVIATADAGTDRKE